MLTTKIRRIIAVIAVIAVGVTLASSGVASAATVPTQTSPQTARPTATAPMVEYNLLLVAVLLLVP
jgi:hypothetical protein